MEWKDWTPHPIPDSPDFWVWLDGKVGFGGQHHEIARKLAEERYDQTQTAYISNMLARNQVPEGHSIAIGTMQGGYPQIYFSTIDRNAVWDDVARMISPDDLDWDNAEVREAKPQQKLTFNVPYGWEDVHPREPIPSRLYHVAPQHAREDILRNGLDPTGRTWNTGSENWNPETQMNFKEAPNGDLLEDEWRPEGIYMFLHPDRARQYAGQDGQDIWEIDRSKLNNIIRDPAMAHNWDGEPDDHAYVTPYVPPHALRLVDPQEHLAAAQWVESPVSDMGHAHMQQRVPWIYIPATQTLHVGSPASDHTALGDTVPEVYEAENYDDHWGGIWLMDKQVVAIHNHYDIDNFDPQEIDPRLLSELRSAFKPRTIEYFDHDGAWATL